VDLSQLPKLDIWQLIAIAAILVVGLRWLRDQQREGYKHDSFRVAVTRIFTEAIQTDDYRNRMRAAVGEAVSEAFEPVTDTLRDHTVDIKRLGGRVSAVEGKVEGILGRMQAQRKSDMPRVVGDGT
jgi:hypothetical protein